ncbi:MAG: leucine-rich repeat domain-containing protein [Bacteroidales bacterium]|nr:leucine-rich repeat domain-containing protein [Bacteroidales bacterium]MDD4684496.1 leucine-rich repeat domain-containing protein [Bacteroidales bacterium]
MNKLIIILLLSINSFGFAQKNGYFNNLDSALVYPNSVITLDLEKQKLKQVPKEILMFPNLDKLILKRNYIKEVPKELSSLSRLRYLDLSSNNITELPKELSALKLDTLIIWDNRIRSFPNEFKEMSETLKYLDLRAIQMNKEEQKEIKALFPKTKIRLAHPCNCNR